MAQQTEKSGGVRIHIDGHTYESPNPTTGTALYALCALSEEFALFEERSDDNNGIAVPNDDTNICLNQDSRFRTGKAGRRIFCIVVNAERKTVKKRLLTFEDVVELAFPDPPTGPYIVFTVTFKNAAGPTHSGSLLPGDTVKIRNGTIFSVTVTDKS